MQQNRQARGGASHGKRFLAAMLLALVVAALAVTALALDVGGGRSRLQSLLGEQHPWAAGACQTLAPLGPDRHRTVFLDPGHGSPDPGTSGVTTAGQRVYEKDLTLATALDLAGRLRQAGYRVVLARTRDMSVAKLSASDVIGGALTAAADHEDLVARVACANAAHAQLLVSLHFNGFSSPGVGGVQTFYDDARPFSSDNLRLAQLVQQNVVAAFAAAGWDEPDRGATADSTDQAPTLTQEAAAYNHLLELGPAQPGYLDHPSAMPGVLCEPLFLTNLHEATIAAGASGRDAIARGIALAVDQFFAQPAARLTVPRPAAGHRTG